MYLGAQAFMHIQSHTFQYAWLRREHTLLLFSPVSVYKHIQEGVFSVFFSLCLTRKHINYMHIHTRTHFAAAPFRAMWKTSAPDASSDSLLCALFSRRTGSFPVRDSIAQAADTTLCHSILIHCKHTHTHSPNAITENLHNGCWHIYVHLHSA